MRARPARLRSVLSRLLGLLGFGVAVAIWPSIPALGTAPRWALLSVAVPALCVSVRMRMTPAHWLGLAFLAYAAASFAWSPVLPDALDGAWRWLVLAGAFALGSECEDLAWFYQGILVGVEVSAIVVAVDLLGVPLVYEIAPPAGLFVNRNFLAEFAALALVGTFGARSFAPGPLFVLGATQSLGAMLGAASAALCWLWRHSKGVAVLVAVLVTIAAGALTLHRHLGSGHVRLAIWFDTAEQLTLLGHGVGSYHAAEAEHSPRQQALGLRELHAHNDLLEAVFEFGLGFLLLAGVLAYALAAPLLRSKLVLVAFLVESSFGFPLHNAATGFVAAVVAGHLCGAGHRLRRSLAGRAEDGGGRIAEGRRR